MSLRFVLGGQVGDIESVVIEPSRLSEHDEPGRIKKLIELTVPADASNGGYAVRQLLGQDPDIGAKSVVTLEVALTQQQIERLKNITEDELRDIRNGVNPAMIYGVRVYDSEPIDVEEFITGKKWPRWFMLPPGLKDSTGNEMVCIRRDSAESGETFCLGGTRYLWHEWHGDDLQLEEITEQEAQAIIAHSVKPTGEWLGCVQWFQHQNPNVIVRRDSREECTIFDGKGGPFSNNEWNSQCVRNVKSGEWPEITQQEAEQRIAYNRNFAGLTAQEPRPGMCKREQFAGGGAPSPRNCDVCLEGPCQQVIPVLTEEAASPAMQAMQKLARKHGVDPTGLSIRQLSEKLVLIESNEQIAQATARLQKAVEIGWEQLPADREMVIKSLASAATTESEMLEFPVEQVEVPRAGIDHVSLIESGWRWNEVCEDNVWNAETWAARRHKFKIRCLPQHLPPARNAAEPKQIPRNIPNLAFVGIDWGKGSDIAATQQVTPMSHMLNLQLKASFQSGQIQPHAWRQHFVMIVNNDVELSAELPAVCLSKQTHFKTPIEWREPVLPKDYGKTVWWHDVEALTHPTHQSGRLVGAADNGSVFVIEPHDKEVAFGRSVFKKKRLVFIIDQQTEGF